MKQTAPLRIVTIEQETNMKAVKMIKHGAVATLFSVALAASAVTADEFTDADIDHWLDEFMTVVDHGEKLFHGGLSSENTVACDQCHPNATNIHPETYPKFQKQLGRVIALREMINWCLQNPLEGEPLELDDPKMVAIEAYVAHERRGVPLEPGKH
jgi:thiosulfate dehydrogenase